MYSTSLPATRIRTQSQTKENYELELFFLLVFSSIFRIRVALRMKEILSQCRLVVDSCQSHSFFCGRTIIMSRFGSRCVANERSHSKFIDIYRVQKRSAVIIVITRFLRCCLYFRILQIEFTTKIAPFSIQIATTQTTYSREKKQFAPVLFCYHIENAPSIF